MKKPVKILTVCLGNICRSPAAEGIFRYQLLGKGFVEGEDFILDSAGTSAWHVGEKPDYRSTEVCLKHNVDISMQRSRLLKKLDGDIFDYIFVMDWSNLENVKSIFDQKNYSKVKMIDVHEVGDPYYSAFDGFEIMYQQLELAIKKWIEKIF